jgi:uncharacterized protein
MLATPTKFEGLDVTFNTTEKCNLACKYCYETSKNSKVLPFEYAKKFIDLLLEDPDPAGLKESRLREMADSALILTFLGGESLIDPDLLRKIINYFMWKSNIMEHQWSNRFRCNISTNGTLFGRKDVRDFMEEFSGVIDVSVSIDGCPTSHDMNRIFKNGKGSMSTILKNWQWYKDWCKRTGNRPKVKATLAKNTIPYIYESLIYLHEILGLNYIFMNFVMEDTGINDSDLIILNDQLEKCYNYLINHPKEVYFSLFDTSEIGFGFNEENKLETRCGSGAMPTISIDGKIYPCLRWLPASMNRPISDSFLLGDVFDKGLNNKLGFLGESVNTSGWDLSDDECKKCQVQSACAYCIAGCYSEFGEFKRTKYLCGVTKLKSYWVTKYWNEWKKLNAT